MIELKQQATLSDLQIYVQKMCAANGWDKSTHLETWLLFTEEIGELAKAIRDTDQLYQEKEKTNIRENLEGEFADVLSYLLHLANIFEINLEQAFRDKEAINAQRNWK